MFIPNGSMVGFESKYSFKHLKTKPLHYLIQLFTGSRLHHVGIMCDGFIYEAKNPEVSASSLQYKTQEISKHVKLHVFEPQKKFTKIQTDKLRKDLNKQLGKEYSTTEAAFSIITAILCQKKPNNEKMFCSKLVFYAYRNLFPRKLENYLPRTMSPEEVKKVLQKEGFLKESYILKIENGKET
jgi:hypothetical protein